MLVVALLTLQAFCGLSVWVLDVDTTFVTDDHLPYEDLVLLVLAMEIPTNSDMELLLASQEIANVHIPVVKTVIVTQMLMKIKQCNLKFLVTTVKTRDRCNTVKRSTRILQEQLQKLMTKLSNVNCCGCCDGCSSLELWQTSHCLLTYHF